MKEKDNSLLIDEENDSPWNNLFKTDSEFNWESSLYLLENESPFRLYNEFSKTEIEEELKTEDFKKEIQPNKELNFPSEELEENKDFFYDDEYFSDENELYSINELDQEIDSELQNIETETLNVTNSDIPQLSFQGENLSEIEQFSFEGLEEYLAEQEDEFLFDEENQNVAKEWDDYPQLHQHFIGKTPQEKFESYLELRPLYILSTGYSNPLKWILDNIIICSFFGKKTPCHISLKSLLEKAENSLISKNLIPLINSFWGFVPRKIRNSQKLSSHALGKAFDINPNTNPQIINKDEILVIKTLTNLDLAQHQSFDSMLEASQKFKQMFTPEWYNNQSGVLDNAIKNRIDRLKKYATYGFLNLDKFLIDELKNVGFTWGGDWKNQKDFMHFELTKELTQNPEDFKINTDIFPGTQKELLKYAQTILNVTENEQLIIDGITGSKTVSAIKRFQNRYQLIVNGTIDDKTLVALTQRALEELHQVSKYTKGDFDSITQYDLKRFKNTYNLEENIKIDTDTRNALLKALYTRQTNITSNKIEKNMSDWTSVPVKQRMKYAMRLLTDKYGYPSNGVAGIVGNLYAESEILPNRIEGSKSETPMISRDFYNNIREFTPEEIMNYNKSAKIGPNKPGIGLAQWTLSSRRKGLFNHIYEGQRLGAKILFNMDAQIDYLVTELRTIYKGVNKILNKVNVSLNEASDEVVYNFEIPGSILSPTGPDGKRRRLPRTDMQVQNIFNKRRSYSVIALKCFF